jgi:hypothetical protein
MNSDSVKPAPLERALPRWRFGLRHGVLAVIVMVALGAAVLGALHEYALTRDDDRSAITGTISDAKAVVKQDGTRQYPYAHESQCPRDTDVVFWSNNARNTQSIAYLPPEISVCFVEIQSAK